MSRTKPSTAGAEGGDLSAWCLVKYGSLRKAASELQVSASYLSYLSRGKRQASKRMTTMLRTAGYGGAL